MEGFGNRDIRKDDRSYGQQFSEMAGISKPSKSYSSTTSYTVRHVQKASGPPKRRGYYGSGQSNLGANAIARGWDDVADAKAQAMGDYDDYEQNDESPG